MIVLTVKTLDSQNHTFTVDDDITVEEFKAKIADTVNIPAETQRIIYCGRVLQDEVKLSDYDVNGKVVHLVQRAPPSQNPATTRSSSPQPTRRGFRGFETENTMYLGSMAFPSNLMESQGIVPPPPTHSLAGSRLNVARRMLRRADAVISLLENPSARPNEQANSEEQQEEEVTPIIEARVIVPPGNNESIDEAMVLSAVQNTLFDAASGSIPMAAEVTIDSNNSQNPTETPPTERSASSTPEEAAPSTTATENTNEQRNGGVNARSLAENASRTSEMAELLTTLNQLQTRFAPYLERYRHFMVEDPIIPQENVRQTQAMLSRVSEVLHFLGHAYHSLSDIIIRVRTPPPRPLLCRPILIQHSAVVQAGIPIQVEVAQFNLSTERPNSTTTSSTTTTNSETTTATTTSGDPTRTTQASPTATSSQPTVNFRGFPFIPAASMRVQSFPIEVRTTARPVSVVHSTQRAQNNNNNTVGGAETRSTPPTTTVTSSNTTNTTNTTRPENTFNVPNFNNSSVEFFMEVTPEVLQGTLNGPPPEFLQSLVQMAGQIMNRITTTTASSDTTTSTTTTASTADASQPNVTSSQTAPGQNSQARGNTQTNPTTATHTRSTPRPHVHLAQQAMQGGFDPFLPCNSHHVTHRRRTQPSTTNRQQPPRQQGQQQDDEEGDQQRDRERDRAASQNLHNLFDEIYSSLRTAYRRRREVDVMQDEAERRRTATMTRIPRATTASANATEANGTASTEAGNSANSNARNISDGGSGADGSTGAGQIPPPLATLLPNLQSTLANLPSMLQGPTIADILQQLPPDEGQINPGESIITDLIMLLSRNLTIVDMITLNTGNFEPLNRVTNEIQMFFNTRVLDGSSTPEAVNAGVDRFVNEMQPFFQNFSRLRVRDDIDIVRSVESLFRRRLPDIITTAINLNSENMRTLVNQCLVLARMMCALALHASMNGQQGVEETFQQIITSYMQGIPTELQNWTMITSCANLRHFMGNLGVNETEVETYVVRTTDIQMSTPPEQNVQSDVANPPLQESEPMELDDPVSAVDNTGHELSTVPPLSVGDDTEPLPNIVLGSEPWHGQVPEDWVPIITRDVQRQRRQNPQTPFSDAYLSGMPTKRRKIVNSTKPQGSLPQVIAESVRRAVTATGLASVAPLEVVSQGAGDSADVQGAYRSLLRTTVQTALRDNEDFTPERFPNASTYFKSQ